MCHRLQMGAARTSYAREIDSMFKKVKAFRFDQGASRDVGVLFLPEVVKTLSNGTCPGHHSGVVQAVRGCWAIDEKMGQTYIWYDQANTLASRDYKQPQTVIYETDKTDGE